MTAAIDKEADVSVQPYVARYALAYVAMCIAFLVLAAAVGDLGSSFSTVIVLVAAMHAANEFEHDHKRPFSRPERLRFCGLALLASLLISSCFVWVLAPQLVAELMADKIGLAVVVVVGGLVTFGWIYLATVTATRAYGRQITS
jgi:hypothetical protein